MNRRVDHITTGRQRRPVIVERRTLSAKPADGKRWSRGEVHEAGTVAVADALCPVGGLMTAERGRAIDARKSPTLTLRRVEAPPPVPPSVPAASLAEDVQRILQGRTDFPRSLWGDLL